MDILQTIDNEVLRQQLRFIVEADTLKSILRHSYLINHSRRENSAEHSWHVSLAALLLMQHAKKPIDIGRVIQMLLVHDIVEIDAGDTLLYDTSAAQQKAEREAAAAERLFGLLPAEQADMTRSLWEEYEARTTPEARYAYAIDRLLPLLHNLHTEGKAWKANQVTANKVLNRNAAIGDSAPLLWEEVQKLLQQAIDRGHLPR